jgi:hypothetical protein
MPTQTDREMRLFLEYWIQAIGVEVPGRHGIAQLLRWTRREAEGREGAPIRKRISKVAIVGHWAKREKQEPAGIRLFVPAGVSHTMLTDGTAHSPDAAGTIAVPEEAVAALLQAGFTRVDVASASP